MIILILILIFILVIASTWWSGLWSNFITLVNLLVAGMAASSFYQTLTAKLMSWQPSYRLLAEFVSLWLIFVVTFIVLRGLTDFLSSIRLKFDFLTEIIGRSLVSVGIACVFVCFTMFSLQMAPLPPNWFGEETQDSDATAEVAEDLKYASAFGPDSLWVSFIRVGSRGAFAESRDENFFLPADQREFIVNEKPLEFDTRAFDPTELFFIDQSAYRNRVAKSKTLRLSN